MAAKCGKCNPEEMCEECPEWIFTLADLIMCMMGLFVILWVLKPDGNPANAAAQAQTETETVAEIKQAFGYKPDPNSNDPIDIYLLEKAMKEGRLRNGPDNAGASRLEQRGADGIDNETTNIRPSRWATTGGRVNFEINSYELSSSMQRDLDQIAAQFRGHRNIIMVKGHTGLDDLPETATPKDKLDLSLRRAQVVADYLVTKGVAPEILRVQGCSTYEPLIERAYTPEARAGNRRAEVYATATLAEDLQDQPHTNQPQLPNSANPAP